MGGVPQQIHIVSDGTGMDTVVSLPDGTKVKNVIGVTIFLEARDLNRASLDLLLPSVDVKALVTEVRFTCPSCNESMHHECGGLP